MNYSVIYDTKDDCLQNINNQKYKYKNINFKFKPILSLEAAKRELIYDTDSFVLKKQKYLTFEYILNNHESGSLYVEIKDGKINKVISLINSNFKNHWSKYITNINPLKYNLNKEKELKMIGKYINKQSKLKKKENWTKNGNLINMFEYSNDDKYFDSYQFELIDLINQTTNNYKIKNTEFIIWCKDVPLMSISGIDTFFPKYKWNHKTTKYLPILSQSTINNYYDIPIPNADECKMVRQKYLPDSCEFDDITIILKVKWEDKISKGFFRGSSTGMANDLTNPRLHAAYLSQLNENLLDIGLVQFVKRDKIDKNGNISYYNPKTFPYNIKLSKKINKFEFSKYKYLLNIEGNGHAYRKSYLFYCKSLVLNVESKFKSWFDDLLIPYEHFIPVKNDLSDLIEIINWCKDNDSKCKQIAKNGYKFAKKHFNTEIFMEYMSKIINL